MTEQKTDYGNTNIVRVRKDARYFVASNIPFNDKRLSWEARGLMGYLLSKPDGWVVRQSDLINQSAAGAKAVRHILAELRQTGYMKRERVKKEHGYFEWVTTIYESPELNNSTMLPLGIDGAGIDAGRIDIVSTELVSTDRKEEEEEKPNAFKFYSNNIELLTEYNSQKLGDLIDTYSENWVIEACKDAIEYGHRKLVYIEGILKRWKQHGFRVDTRSKQKTKLPYSAPSAPVKHI